MTELEKYEAAFRECHRCTEPFVLEELEAGMKRDVVASEKLQFRIFRIEPNGADIFPYFSHGEGLNNMCDYFVFIETSDLVYAFAVELKKNDGSPNRQLKRSEVFLNFFHDRMMLSDRLSPGKKMVIGKIGVSDKHRRTNVRNDGIQFDQDRVARINNNRAVYLDVWVSGLDRVI